MFEPIGSASEKGERRACPLELAAKLAEPLEFWDDFGRLSLLGERGEFMWPLPVAIRVQDLRLAAKVAAFAVAVAVAASW